MDISYGQFTGWVRYIIYLLDTRWWCLMTPIPTCSWCSSSPWPAAASSRCQSPGLSAPLVDQKWNQIVKWNTLCIKMPLSLCENLTQHIGVNVRHGAVSAQWASEHLWHASSGAWDMRQDGSVCCAESRRCSPRHGGHPSQHGHRLPPDTGADYKVSSTKYSN